ncbi:hypothetical protein [Mycobacteroides abscessus]|uniref:hypothetical protein n=1 Tax=Mycobacteroides abscessus TaxID=36809 RepID=UPI000940EB79|nr:hypothetical protein [Mycobacteroides abscessus]
MKQLLYGHVADKSNGSPVAMRTYPTETRWIWIRTIRGVEYVYFYGKLPNAQAGRDQPGHEVLIAKRPPERFWPDDVRNASSVERDGGYRRYRYQRSKVQG